jgi:hypothetical protein
VARAKRDPRQPAGGRAASAFALASLAVASGVLALAIAQWLRHREALVVLWGGARWTWVGALSSSAGALIVALQAERRAWRAGSRPGSLAGVARKLVTCAVFGWLAVHWLLQPMRVLYLELAAGIVAGAFGLAIAVEHALGPARLARTRRALDFALFNLCALALGGEIALRWAASVKRSPLLAQADVGTEQMIRLHRGYRTRMRLGFPFNSEEFYDTERPARSPDRRLVVAIGDSFAVGVVPHWFHYTTVAERELGVVDVYNAGVGGIGPSEYIELVDTVAKPMRPDAIVVSVFVGNDVEVPLRLGPTAMTRLRRWFSRDNLLVYLVPKRMVEVSEAGAIDAAAGQGGDELWETPEEMRLNMPWLDDPTREPPGYTPDLFARIERDRAHAVLGSGPEAYRAIDAALGELARRCGPTPLLVMLVPDEFQVEEAVWQEIVAAVPAAEQWDRFLPQKVLSEICARHGIAALDLLPALRAVEPLADGRRHVYHLADSHFNARGNAVAARALAARLRPMLGL